MDLVRLAEVLGKLSANDLLFRVLSRDDVQAFIINLNTEDQLKTKNQDALGVKLSSNDPFGGYSITTQYLKNTTADKVTLYESFVVIPYRNASFDIESNTSIHGEDLRERWGANIEGIDSQNFIRLNVYLEEKIIDEIERLL